MRIAELCAGYGGLFLALQHVSPGAELAWYAEVDHDAMGVMESHYPHIQNHGDVLSVDWKRVDQVDVLAAGFPCQPMSCAGKRRGAKDDRHVWPTGVLPAISRLRPGVVILENVPGLLTIDGGSIFRQILTDIGLLGYTIRWTTVGACKLGACHHRHRTFIAATRDAGELPYAFGMPIGAWSSWPRDGVSNQGLVWSQSSNPCGGVGLLLPTPCAADGANRGTGLGTYADPSGRPLREVIAMMPEPGASDDGRWGRWCDAIESHAGLVGRPAPDPTITGIRGGLRLNPEFAEWMMCLAPGWITGSVDDPNCCNRLAGNGVVPLQAALAISSLGVVVE